MRTAVKFGARIRPPEKSREPKSAPSEQEPADLHSQLADLRQVLQEWEEFKQKNGL